MEKSRREREEWRRKRTGSRENRYGDEARQEACRVRFPPTTARKPRGEH